MPCERQQAEACNASQMQLQLQGANLKKDSGETAKTHPVQTA